RVLRRPVAWAAVALVNFSAMTIFLWHQTALMATTATGLLAGRLPGLHTRPDGLEWVAARIAWLPVFALVLAGCWATFRSCEQHGRGRGRSRVVRAHRPRRRATTAGARHV
ncbi:acyltransferase, partial [Streptomyces sp. SID5926]|nr:acyltransferase [Streptomyces sp. SID5926]